MLGERADTRNFNPRSPHGERRRFPRLLRPTGKFQSTLPARGATGTTSTKHTAFIFQSTLPARGATTPQEVTLTSKTFQSTLPARGATADKRCNQLRKRFQSTLPARGATVSAVYNFLYEKFQSTLPARGATIPTEEMTDPDGISIHAPRTGSDAHGGKPASARRDFNPRSPHGERRTQVMTTSSSLTFQSTLPARGATMKQERASRICLFQSTLPARGATVSSNSIIKTKTFQSTLPARGATWCFAQQ